jgi:hypothetical protein
MLKNEGNTISLPRVYYSRKTDRILVSTVLLFFLAFLMINLCSQINGAIILLSSNISEKLNFIISSVLSIIINLVGLLFSFLLFGRKINSKLIISNEGLEYRNLFYNLSTRWQDIQGINRYGRSFLDPHGGDSLRLSHSEIGQNSQIMQWVIKSGGANLNIPINDFAWRWRSSEMGKIIRDHAIKLNFWFIDQ